jgi:hypothetical protein
MFNNPSSTTVRSVDKFDHRIDQLVDQLTPVSPIATMKDSRYLNWRYADRPFKKESLFIAETNGRLTGAMVLKFNPYRPEGRTGVVVDLVVDPKDTVTLIALCRAAVRFFIDQRANAIGCIITNPEIARVFRKFAFRREATGKAVLLGNLPKAAEDRMSLERIENWSLTRGDSDGFMLSA